MVELCRSTYSHFVVTKLIEYAKSTEMQRKIQKSLKGHVPRLV